MNASTSNTGGQNSGHSAKIMVVDDDVRLRDLLRRYLTEQGFQVVTAESAPAMNKLWLRERYDLLVLDLMLPGEDGLSICRRLRGAGDQTPIIMLTAKGEDVDRIVGLEMGADDYLPKPFNPRELLARIQALVRRQRMLGAHAGPAPAHESVRFGAFTLHLGERRLVREDAGGGAEALPLTSGEFALLQALALHPHRPLGRERLIALARGPDHEATDRSIDVQVMRLRKLIEADSAQPRHIRTVWGVGYMFVP